MFSANTVESFEKLFVELEIFWLSAASDNADAPTSSNIFANSN
jgi:hypothetical protein